MSIFKSKKPIDSALLFLGIEELLSRNHYVLNTSLSNKDVDVWTHVLGAGPNISFNQRTMSFTTKGHINVPLKEGVLFLIGNNSGGIVRSHEDCMLHAMDKLDDDGRLELVREAGSVLWERRRKANRKELLNVLLPAAASTLFYGGVMWALGAAYGRRTAG